MEKTRTEFIGKEMPDQCKYCRYDKTKCNKKFQVLSYRYGYRLCPNRIDLFSLSLEELGIDQAAYLDIIDKGGINKKWIRPYYRPVTIFIDYTDFDKISFAVKYHEEFIRDCPEETLHDELTDLIHNVVTDTINETSLRDLFYN